MCETMDYMYSYWTEAHLVNGVDKLRRSSCAENHDFRFEIARQRAKKGEFHMIFRVGSSDLSQRILTEVSDALLIGHACANPSHTVNLWPAHSESMAAHAFRAFTERNEMIHGCAINQPAAGFSLSGPNLNRKWY
jgi:hypothetical protein